MTSSSSPVPAHSLMPAIFLLGIDDCYFLMCIIPLYAYSNDSKFAHVDGLIEFFINICFNDVRNSNVFGILLYPHVLLCKKTAVLCVIF